MVAFKKVTENIDLFSTYEKNEYAKLSLVYDNVVEMYSDYMNYHIYHHHLKYLMQENINGSVDMARIDYIEKENVVLIAEDYLCEDESITRIYAKYNINTFDLEVILITSDSFNCLFRYD